MTVSSSMVFQAELTLESVLYYFVIWCGSAYLPQILFQPLFLVFFMFKPWQLLCRSDAVSALNSLKSNWKNTPPTWIGSDPCGGGWEGIWCTGSRITSMYVTQC